MRTLANREPQDLSPDELLALLEGSRIQRRQSLLEVVERFIASPAVLREDAVAQRLSDDLEDPVLRVDVLRSLARVADPIGPDLLNMIRQDRSRNAETQRLAGALLRTLEVRQHLSQALEVALELEDVKDCSRAAELVALAIEHGDRRSLASLNRLTKTSGCDPEAGADCFPCLRSGTELLEALETTGERRPPDLPAIARSVMSSADSLDEVRTASKPKSKRKRSKEPESGAKSGEEVAEPAPPSSTSESLARPAAPQPEPVVRTASPSTRDPGF
jgi:hypothetical protein